MALRARAGRARNGTLARSLVGTWGADTLSPFALRADKSYFFAANEDAFLAYRVVGGVAIVSGDPIGEPDALEPLFARFLVFARGRGWRVAVLGASEDALPLYRRLQLRAIYHGDEAVLDVAAFSLEGRSIRKVRQSVQRLEREGYTVQIARPADVSPAARLELERIADDVAGRRATEGVRDGARYAVRTWRRRRRVRDRERPRRTPRGLHSLRDVACLRRAVVVIDATAADNAKRIQRMADLQHRGVGT